MKHGIIITGHLGGLGTSLAERFADAGYSVIGIDKAKDKHLSFPQISADLSKIADPEVAGSLGEELTTAIGSTPLVALVNNAAIQHLGPLVLLDTDLFLESLNVNVIAPLILVRLLLPHLERSHGVVINVNSIHASLTKPGFSAYSISKAALAGLTRAMAVELGESIRVIEVRPAAVATPMLEAGFAGQPENRRLLDEFHPTGRIGSPAGVAQMIQQLVETEVDFLNGTIVNIDGGISHRLHDPT